MKYAEVTPPRAWIGAMRWMVAIAFICEMPAPAPDDDRARDRERKRVHQRRGGHQRHARRRCRPARAAWRPHCGGGAGRAGSRRSSAATSAAKRPATTGWVMCTCSSSCRYEGDNPKTQPTTMNRPRPRARWREEGGRMSAGTWMIGVRGRLGASFVGRVSGIRTRASGQNGDASTMSSDVGRHGRPRRGPTPGTRSRADRAVSPAAAATDGGQGAAARRAGAGGAPGSRRPRTT